MAIADHNNGRFIGKLGKTVSYMLKGKYVMRTIGIYKGKRSPLQLANQMSMKLTMRFLAPLKPFIDLGYGLEAMGTDKSPFNLATSSVKTQAIKGEYPNLEIDYSKVMLSKGKLPAPEETAITKADQGILFKWNPEVKGAYRNLEDSVMILLYFPEKNQSLTTFHGAKRKDGSCFFELPPEYQNIPVETYISFKQSDGKAVSDSVYVGNLNTEADIKQDAENHQKYVETKQRFDIVAGILKEKFAPDDGKTLKNKVYKSLVKEYEVLKERLKNMPGKAIS